MGHVIPSNIASFPGRADLLRKYLACWRNREGVIVAVVFVQANHFPACLRERRRRTEGCGIDTDYVPLAILVILIVKVVDALEPNTETLIVTSGDECQALSVYIDETDFCSVIKLTLKGE